MKIVVDVNIVLSALIRDSSTRKIIRELGQELYFPEPSLHKLRKYQDYVIGKAGLNEKDYTSLLKALFNSNTGHILQRTFCMLLCIFQSRISSACRCNHGQTPLNRPDKQSCASFLQSVAGSHCS